jgi:alpha-galactosidase
MSIMAKVDQAGSDPTVLAPTPPMGWNSWNSFATTINEAQALETAAIMAEKLLPSGYDIFTIDIQWYEPGATSYTYNTKPVPTMDPCPQSLPLGEGRPGLCPDWPEDS